MLFSSLTRPLSIAAFSLLATLPLHAQFTDITWQGADGDTWSPTESWSPADVPDTNTERAVINGTLNGGATVNLNGSFNYTLGGLDIASGFTLTRDGNTNHTLILKAATASDTTFNNAGSIISGGTSGSLTLVINQTASGTPANNSHTVANTGLIEATAATELIIQSEHNNNAVLLNNTGGTLRTAGSGTLYLGSVNGGSPVYISGGSLQNMAGTVNQGRISTFTDVAITNGGTYNVLNSGSNTEWEMRLAGTSSLTNTGTMMFVRDFSGQNNIIRATGLRIEKDADASVLNSGTINFITNGNTVDGTSNTGLDIRATTQIVNDGSINLESRSATHATRITIASNVTATFSGEGEIHLNVGTGGSADKVQIHGTGTSTLINGTGHTIRGAGQLGSGSLGTLTNAGTLHADDATHALTIDLNGTGTTGTFTNAGTLHAAGAAGLVMVDGAATNSGTVRVDSGSSLTIQDGSFTSTAGTLQVDGTLDNTPDLSIANTTITGQGSITGDVNIDGPSTFTPGGATAHVLTIGNLAFNEATSVQTISFNFDHFDARIDVTGALTHGLNNLLEFNFGTDAGYQTNTTYTLFTTGGTDLLIDALSISATSLSAGFALDSGFGSDGWQLDGNDLQVRFSGVAGLIPEPAQAALFAGMLGCFAVVTLRRRRHVA